MLPSPDPRPATSLAALIQPHFWDALVGDSETVHVSAGDLIYGVGDSPPVLAILSGGARAFIRSAAGRQFTFRYAKPGEVIGLGPRLGGLDTSSAEAVTDTTAAILSLGHVHELALVNPALSWTIAEHVARWAADVVRGVADAERLPMTARLARHLLEVCGATADGDATPITHQRLADALGTAREVISRTLRVLRQAGAVRTSPGYVVITDADRLTLFAHGDDTVTM